MLVDLGRNDVGKVAQMGSVSVETFMEVERYSHVMHISSTVKGRLLPELNAWDVMRAALPAGTVSGAPKVCPQLPPLQCGCVDSVCDGHKSICAGSAHWPSRYDAANSRCDILSA